MPISLNSPRWSWWFLTKVGMTLIGGLLVIIGFCLALERGYLNIIDVQIRPAEASLGGPLFDRIQQSLQPEMRKWLGKNIFSAQLNELAENILKDRRIQKVNLTRQFPSTLKIEIVPKRPVLNLLNSDGRLSPISVDASLLPAMEISMSSDLPILRGQAFKVDATLREKAIALLADLPTEGEITEKTVSEISYSKYEGYVLRINGASGKIILGEAPFGAKVSKLNKVMNYLYDRSLTWRILDARFSKKVVVKLQDPT